MNGFCEKCIYYYLLCGDEPRCSKIKLGMSDEMCVKVSKCCVYKENKMLDKKAIDCLMADKEYLQDMNVCDGEEMDVAIKAIKKVQKYRKIEKRLEKMFDGKLPLETYVDELENVLKEPNNPHPMNARILTYEESAEWEKYLEAKEEIESKSGKSLDIIRLVHYFLDTIFNGEKHDKFCVLTNEDADKWDEYCKLNEQGLLLKLPCERVWFICDKGSKYATIMSKSIYDLELYQIEEIDLKEHYFSTREKAEEKLRELEMIK